MHLKATAGGIAIAEITERTIQQQLRPASRVHGFGPLRTAADFGRQAAITPGLRAQGLQPTKVTEEFGSDPAAPCAPSLFRRGAELQ